MHRTVHLGVVASLRAALGRTYASSGSASYIQENWLLLDHTLLGPTYAADKEQAICGVTLPSPQLLTVPCE
jgi:hypothetical protein